MRRLQYGKSKIPKKCAFHHISNSEKKADYNIAKITFDKTPHIKFPEEEEEIV